MMSAYSGVFDTDQIKLMTAALNDLLTTIARSQDNYAISDEAIRTALAMYILNAVNQGEHDPSRLREGALANLASMNKL